MNLENNTKLICILIFLIFLSKGVHAIQYNYNIEIEYDNGELILKNISIKLTEKEVYSRKCIGELFHIHTISFQDEIINISEICFSLKLYYDELDPQTGNIIGGKEIILNKTKKAITIPYYENAKEIIIYDKDLNKKLTIDVSSYAKEISKQAEEKLIIEDKKEEPIEKISKTENKPTNYTSFIIFGVIAFMIFLFIIIKIIRSKKTDY